MYISEISGHHSATIAIENALNKLSPDSEILNINAFNYTNPISEKIINRLYMSVIKMTPRIWDYLYDNPEVAKNISLIILKYISKTIVGINHKTASCMYNTFWFSCGAGSVKNEKHIF